MLHLKFCFWKSLLSFFITVFSLLLCVILTFWIVFSCIDIIVQRDLNKYGLPDGIVAVVNLCGENLMNPAKRQVHIVA